MRTPPAEVAERERDKALGPVLAGTTVHALPMRPVITFTQRLPIAGLTHTPEAKP